MLQLVERHIATKPTGRSNEEAAERGEKRRPYVGPRRNMHIICF